ncbi:hypothetical protein BKA67DRAFT_664240 [Truncatella angustata]|uniref:Uncharacterized protein n=1 Tax=Truncatella angustata TaxID=152316 RepID=A0A9P8UC85_9PEZI|nr:uncharacterized protein BKA67DRAFT_664240 [Truncatella angustata]KAH6646401.1 hypothetical protein BKA67DRAFT_664240 [Truncatella angustata]KAH8200033.1 hypothetical protein TruAng_005809 [Truncatella angustata]
MDYCQALCYPLFFFYPRPDHPKTEPVYRGPLVHCLPHDLVIESPPVPNNDMSLDGPAETGIYPQEVLPYTSRDSSRGRSRRPRQPITPDNAANKWAEAQKLAENLREMKKSGFMAGTRSHYPRGMSVETDHVYDISGNNDDYYTTKLGHDHKSFMSGGRGPSSKTDNESFASVDSNDVVIGISQQYNLSRPPSPSSHVSNIAETRLDDAFTTSDNTDSDSDDDSKHSLTITEPDKETAHRKMVDGSDTADVLIERESHSQLSVNRDEKSNSERSVSSIATLEPDPDSFKEGAK